MNTQPEHLEQTADFTEAELKRIYDEHVAAEDEGDVSPEEVYASRESLRKLNVPSPK
jgi:hypothetical protein